MGTTVVITTHYIEEARKAGMVGLMRSGRMLVEDNPSSLMQKFDMPSLEKVFLGLCRRQGKHLSGKEGDKWTI